MPTCDRSTSQEKGNRTTKEGNVLLIDFFKHVDLYTAITPINVARRNKE